jgi:hypothetical protein
MISSHFAPLPHPMSRDVHSPLSESQPASNGAPNTAKNLHQPGKVVAAAQDGVTTRGESLPQRVARSLGIFDHIQSWRQCDLSYLILSVSARSVPGQTLDEPYVSNFS